MDTILTRRFKENDTCTLLEIIQRNIMEINIKDYSYADVKKLSDSFTKEKIINLADIAHTYVAYKSDIVVGCGTIASYYGSKNESILLTIFVHPECHGSKIGTAIMNTLEKDDLFKRSKRIEIPSSITAYEFYKKFGYNHKNGIMKLDNEGHYRLEKFRYYPSIRLGRL